MNLRRRTHPYRGNRARSNVRARRNMREFRIGLKNINKAAIALKYAIGAALIPSFENAIDAMREIAKEYATEPPGTAQA